MSRNTILAPDSYYHIYNRGTESRVIFQNQYDHERFLALIYICNNIEPVRIENIVRSQPEQGLTLLKEVLKIERNKPLIDVCSYCLMPNHFHFILKEREDGGISKFMQKIMTAYTMYFNKRYERNGSLFQGSFKANLVDTDNYLKYLISYVHLNPIKLIEQNWKEERIQNMKRAEKFLDNYKYSSYLDFCGTDRLEGLLINKNGLPNYFENSHGFQSAVTEWLDYNNKNLSKV